MKQEIRYERVFFENDEKPKKQFYFSGSNGLDWTGGGLVPNVEYAEESREILKHY